MRISGNPLDGIINLKPEKKEEYPKLGHKDVCRLMELSYDMGKKGEKDSLWELYNM